MRLPDGKKRNPDELADELLRRLADQRTCDRDLVEARRRIAEYEAKFGIPSAEIHAAIDDGELIETLEVVHWIFEWESLKRAELVRR